LKEAYEVLLLHDLLQVLKYLSELLWIPLFEVRRELQWCFWITSEQELLILLKLVHHYDVITNLILAIKLLDVICKLDKLIREHIVKEHLQALVWLIIGKATYLTYIRLSGCLTNPFDI
jgi:hypothetical protein